MVWWGRSLGSGCLGDGVDADEAFEQRLRAWRRRVDEAANRMFAEHPDLDLDQDSMVLNLEDIQELAWLDCEIGIEHLAGRHRRSGCPYGCLFRER